MSREFIPVAAPVFVGNERAYVLDAVDSTWVSSLGEYIDRFQRAFGEFCGAKHAIACCNGTAALHAALAGLGVGEGEEVIVPTLTFVATANAVVYCRAKPVFVDSDPDTWTIDPARIEAAVTPRTTGIVPVHLYGHPAHMDEIRAIARRHGLWVLEDAAEAHGAEYRCRRVGALADVGVFSFYGNKVITTGEGGMVVTDDDELAATIRLLCGQGMSPTRRYWHPTVGFNYRMTNLEAAIGLAQLERIDWHVARRLEIAAQYRERLTDVRGVSFHEQQPWARHAYWMFSVLLDEGINRDEVMARLRARGIDSRPVFYPIHTMPPYEHVAAGQSFPVAEDIARRGLNLPTWAGLTEDDVGRVCDALAACVGAT